MNNQRRKSLQEAITLLQSIQDAFDRAKELIETAKDEESEAYENMPEGLQSSERGEQSQTAVSELENAFEALDSCDLNDVIANIETACE